MCIDNGDNCKTRVPKIQEKWQKTSKICYDIYGDLYMNNFTFLTDEQIFGNSQLDILKNYGTKCAITRVWQFINIKMFNFSWN